MDKQVSLSKSEMEKAKKENSFWKKKSFYWHNAIPIFDHEIRNSLTRDVQTVCNFQQLELNKRLYQGIQWNNRLNIIISIINLIFFGINLYLFIF